MDNFVEIPVASEVFLAGLISINAFGLSIPLYVATLIS